MDTGSQSVAAEEATDEAQRKPENELHDGRMAGTGDDKSITDARQSTNDDAHSEPAGAKSTDSNSDHKVVH